MTRFNRPRRVVRQAPEHDRRSTRVLGVSAIGIGLLAGMMLVIQSSAAAEASVDLGRAEPFSVLAGTGVTNTGPSVLAGNLGSCPTPALTGFTGPPNGTVLGTTHANDAVACGAQSDLTIAYDDAAGRAPTVVYPEAKDLVGLTLTTGVYKSPTEFSNAGTLTLDAQGDPNAVWVFQAGSTLITSVNSRIVMINSARPCNVFWQVGSSATLGVGSTFAGTILALTSITANTNAVIEGRLLARNGAVTLDANVITTSACALTTTTEPGGGSTTSSVAGGVGATSTTLGTTPATPGTVVLTTTTIDRLQGPGTPGIQTRIPALPRTGPSTQALGLASALALIAVGGLLLMVKPRRGPL